MARRVSCGRDYDAAPELDKIMEEGSNCNYDFYSIPIVHPHPRPERLDGPVLERPGPFLRSDMILNTSEWASLVVGKISDWIDLDAEDDNLRFLSEKALLQELDFAVHLSLPAVLIPLKSRKCANLARFLNEHLYLGPSQQIWVHVPMKSPSCKEKSSVNINGQTFNINDFPSLGGDSDTDDAIANKIEIKTNGIPDQNGIQNCVENMSVDKMNDVTHVDLMNNTDCHDTSDDDDPWQWFNVLRTLCDSPRRIAVCLELSLDLPDESSLKRWLGEPVKCAMLPTNVFLSNRKGFPVLSRTHQTLVRQLMRLQTQFLITGPAKHFDKSEICFYQYLEYLLTSMEEPDGVEKFSKGYEDYLQAPLQPLMDNLESQTYEVFEKDPIKYVTYEEAIREALVDRIPEAEKDTSYQVVMVVGAGRGPLVRAVFSAADFVQRKVRVYAVEKNPNAVLTLRTLQKEIWSDKEVTIVWHDMRTWEAPEKADILVSELLGSFGDNELSPECLDGAQKFLKPDGISIPSEYTSFVAPLQSSKLFNEVRSNKERDKHPLANMETPYVVRLHNCHVLDKPKQLFQFKHPNWGIIDNTRYKDLKFDIKEDAVLHGFAGYFHTVLYKSHCLSIVPESYSHGMFSWFPIYFPIREPIFLPRGSEMDLNFWRRVDAHKVWYEWTITKPVPIPIHNPKARSYWIGL